MSPTHKHDIFISYRYNDNRSGWVTAFVDSLKEELAATLKDPVSIYFDSNPTEGLKDNYHVDKSLADKVKTSIFIPILSQTYCDPRSYAWQKEFCSFVQWAGTSEVGVHILLSNGNVASRILPVKIHDIDTEDQQLFQDVTGEAVRSVDFIYKSAGVNRPLRVNEENPHDNINKTIYLDQINKLANAIKEILSATGKASGESASSQNGKSISSSESGRISSEELSMDEKLLQKLNKAVEDNLGNELFSVEDLADEVAYSRSYLHRKLQRLRGVSISQFIRGIRLQHGYELLKKDVGTVSEIAYRVGFSSNTYFTKCFREQFGISPGEVKSRGTVSSGIMSSATEAVLEARQVSTKATGSPLEALHPAASETLIREIFDELVRHKPELEKFLLVNEEEGETVDSRLLAYQIIKSFPFPIGIELRRLFSGKLLANDKMRFDQLTITIDRCIKFLSFILISEYADQIHTGRISGASPSIISRESLNKVSIESLSGILETVSSIMRNEGIKFFAKELDEVLDEAFFREIGEIVKLHDQENHEYASFDERFTSLEQGLIFILKRLAFLAKYRLVNVDSIEVNKPKYKEASFEHRLHILNSADTELNAHKESLQKFSDSRAVLLMKSIKEPDQFLNLSPLVIDTHAEDTTSKEKVRLKKDIYLFNGCENEKIRYAGVESGSESDLTLLDNYQQLIDEYNVLLTLIGQP